MKQLLSLKATLLLVAMAWFANVNVFAAFVQNGIMYSQTSQYTVEVVANTANPYSGDVVIPGTFQYRGATMSVTGIAARAFRNCNITSISIPATVTTIGNSAFAGCTSLNAIDCAATVPPTLGTSVFEEDLYGICALHVPSESITAYQAAEVWKKFVISLDAVTLNSKGYATYSSTIDVELDNADAFGVKVEEDKTLTVGYMGQRIKASTGVLLKGEPGATVHFTATTAWDVDTPNDLKPVAAAMTTPANCYVLNGEQFHPYIGAQLVAGKAYLIVENANGARLNMVFNNDATGIETVATAEQTDSQAYNMMGQHVNKGAKGIVIINGRKQINK